MKKVKLAAFLLITCLVAHSENITPRENVIRASQLSYVEGIKPGFVWVSAISVESKPVYLSNSSGTSIMTIPLTVVSAYDSTSTRYDVSNLYALKNERI